MQRSLPTWQKNTLRLLAWGCLLLIVGAAGENLASGQEHGVVIEVANEGAGGFFSGVMTAILTFDTQALMALLGQPRYSIPAFIALNVIVFVETGLLIGFFLPGDSLLVITGLICASPHCRWSLPLLLTTLSVSAIVGDTVGYWIGHKTGPKIFNREKSLFFNKDHLLKAQQFYEKHGPITIVLARFIPILRTFAPVVAGVGKMEYRKFLTYNIVGGVSWIVSMVLAGYYLPALVNPMVSTALGREFHVERHVEKVVIIVVFLSILPGIFAWLKNKLAGKTATPKAEAATETSLLKETQEPPLAA